MSETITVKAVGLFLQGNDIEAPEGAMSVADNVTIGKDNIAESRRGLPPVATKALTRVFPFKGGLLGWGSGTLSHSADGITWVDKAGTYAATDPVHAASQNGNAYVTSDGGLRRVEALTGAAMAAGIPTAPDIQAIPAAPAAAGRPFAPNTTGAYRVLWGRYDANGNMLLGAPSGRAIAINSDAVNTYGAALYVPLPPGCDATWFCQVYRSPVVASTLTPTDDLQLVMERQAPPPTATIVSLTRAAGTVTATTSAPHGWPGINLTTGEGYTPGIRMDPADVHFAAVGVETTITITGASTFTYAQAGADATSTVNCVAEVMDIWLQDYQPETMLGAALYTNEGQEGALAANERVAAPWDVCAFRDMLVMAGAAVWPRISVSYLGGIQAGDTITVNGVAFTFRAGAAPLATDLLIGATGSVAGDIAFAARQIVAGVQYYRPRIATARYTSSATDVPGKFVIEALNGGDALTVSVSRPSSFTPKTLAVEPAPPNIVAVSKKKQPDAVPPGYRWQVSTADDPVQRVVPTRDAVFVLKSEDGVWRLTGDSPENIRIDPFDLNTKLVAPETACAIDNKVFALTEQGVVAMTPDGVSLVSRQAGGSSIEDAIMPLLAGSMRAVTAALAYAVAYESERLYLLALPSSASDTTCTQFYVYNLITQAWTRWDKASAHGLVNPADDRLYLVDGTSVLRERKDYAATDYADAATAVTISAHSGLSVTLADASAVSAGDVIGQSVNSAIVTAKASNVLTVDRTVAWSNAAATAYAAIPWAVEWVPKFAPPGMMHLFREGALAFRSAAFHAAQLSLSTDLTTTPEQVSLALSSSQTDHPWIRFSMPRNAARGSLLRLKFAHRQAWSPTRLQALRVIYNPGTMPLRSGQAVANTAPGVDGWFYW